MPAAAHHPSYGCAVTAAEDADDDLAAAQRDVVGLGDGVGRYGPEPFADTLPSLPEKLERVGERTLRGGALRISLVLFEEMGLEGGSDFVDALGAW